MTSHLTTHVLDASAGRPAAGIDVLLEQKSETGWTEIATSSAPSSWPPVPTGSPSRSPTTSRRPTPPRSIPRSR